MTQKEKNKVLIITNDDQLVGVLQRYLEAHGFRVNAETDGMEGLQNFQQNTPHVVILDKLLPKLNGFDLCQTIKDSKYGRHIPVIIMAVSSASNTNTDEHVLKGMADYYLEKPFQFSELLRVIKMLLSEIGESGEFDASGSRISPKEEHKSFEDEEYIKTSELIKIDSIVDEVDIDDEDGPPVEIEEATVPLEGGNQTNEPIDILGNFSDVFIDDSRVEQSFDGEIRESDDKSVLEDNFLFPPYETEVEFSELDYLVGQGRVGYVIPMDLEEDSSIYSQPVQYGEIQIPQLLYKLFIEKFDGLLVLKKGNLRKRIHFENGKPVAANSNARYEYLGQKLLSQGIISEDEHKKVLDYMVDNNCQQGEAFLKLQILDHDRLYELLRKQVEERVMEVFSWTYGEYCLYVENESIKSMTTFQINPIALIFMGVRSRFPLEPIVSDFDSTINKFFYITDGASERLSALQLYKEATGLVALADGNKRLSEMLSISQLGLITFMRSAYALHVLNIADFSSDPVKFERDYILESGLSDEAVEENLPLSLIDEGTEPEIRRRIIEDYLSYKRSDLFQVLGLDEDAADEEIEIAYHKRVTFYQQEVIDAISDDDLRTKGQEILKRTQHAYNILKDKQTRERYIKNKEIADDTGDHNRLIQAEIQFKAGKRAIIHKDFHTAVDAFDKAVKINRLEPSYLMYLGWATYLVSAKGSAGMTARDRARKFIRKALLADSSLVLGYYFLGVIQKNVGDLDRAIALFKRALQLNPDMEEAKRELEAISEHKPPEAMIMKIRE